MIEISVRNVRAYKHGEYIGRACYGWRESVLGNPFKVGRDGARGECVARYRVWLIAKLDAGDVAIVDELARLARVAKARGSLALLCWCAPDACHGDVIADVLRERFGVR